MPIAYRSIAVDETDAFWAANTFGFGRDPQPEWHAAMMEYADIGRSLAAFDGLDIVGTSGSWSFEMTVPGATLPCAGVTWVSVLPTHRRRGILTGMMQAQLGNIRDRGEAIAALWASEAPIYSRFGYGLAADRVDLHIERAHAALRPATQPAGHLRGVDREEALGAWPRLYERVRPSIPGLLSRSPAWWANRHLRLPSVERPLPGFGQTFRVQYEEGGDLLGYVRYRVHHDDQDGNPAGELRIGELIAATDTAYRALWEYILGVDLMATVRYETGGVDEPLLAMLQNPRRLVRQPADSLWVRVVDVVRALEARHYPIDGHLVLEVYDAFLPAAGGRFDLSVEGGIARCAPTTREPSLRVSAEDLGAVYLGGTRLRALARAGRVEGESNAIGLANLLFSWDPSPWCPEIF